MNGAQRDALNRMVEVADMMSNVCFNLEQRPSIAQEDWRRHRTDMRELHIAWDAARNRYFELEYEAANLKASAQGRTRQRGNSTRESGAANDIPPAHSAGRE